MDSLKSKHSRISNADNLGLGQLHGAIRGAQKERQVTNMRNDATSHAALRPFLRVPDAVDNSADSVDRETSCREIGVYKTNQSALKLHADKAFKRILVGTLRAVERADIFLLAVFADV